MDEIYNSLRSFHRRDLDSWKLYLGTYYRHFHTLQNYYRPLFHRRWRFQLYCSDLKTLTLLKNSIITPYSAIGNIPKKDQARHIVKDLDQNLEVANKLPVIAFGSGNWGRAGQPPLPVKKVSKFLARFALVVMVPEHKTSQTCPLCDHQIREDSMRVFICGHKKSKRYINQPRPQPQPPPRRKKIVSAVSLLEMKKNTIELTIAERRF